MGQAGEEEWVRAWWERKAKAKEANKALRMVGRRRRDRIAEEVEEARRQRDPRGEWRALNALGGRGKGPKKRSMAVGRMDMPTSTEWRDFLAQRGFEGGALPRSWKMVGIRLGASRWAEWEVCGG